ncbi:hypothetical protein KM043_008608 [Ampulex compressa]|nr:hypothetical protein KM043_008608 [Ampulex compressa]
MLCVCGLWKTGTLSWQSSSVRAKASIQFDLTLPSSTMAHRPLNRTSRKIGGKGRRKYQDALSRYMMQLYRRRPEADIVRALQPIHVSAPLTGGGRILSYAVPSTDPEESLKVAELLGNAGTILDVRPSGESLENRASKEGCRSRREDAWRAFNVTSFVSTRNTDVVRLHVRGRLGYRPCGDTPILLLSYSKAKKKRHRRSVGEQDEQEDGSSRWEEEGGRRRRRNACRRRPLYVDFALIAYDEWVVAPPGYEAYQCAGKCFYPFGDHLSPTKHAIVQTLVHGALQGAEGLSGNRPVGRACCVPTRLGPTSLLYLDASGTLTYQYGYEDMVVVECGCR